MASRLLRAGFIDGALFHIYHAYECVISSMIAANGYNVPPEGKTSITLPRKGVVKGYPSPAGIISETSTHKARLLFFNELADKTKLYYRTHSSLSRFISYSDRNDALYYNAKTNRLPHEKYNSSAFAQSAMKEVRSFAEQVWQEIK